MEGRLRQTRRIGAIYGNRLGSGIDAPCPGIESKRAARLKQDCGDEHAGGRTFLFMGRPPNRFGSVSSGRGLLSLESAESQQSPQPVATDKRYILQIVSAGQ